MADYQKMRENIKLICERVSVGFGQLAVSILIVENGGIGEFLFEIQEFAFEAFEFGKHQ